MTQCLTLCNTMLTVGHYLNILILNQYNFIITIHSYHISLTSFTEIMHGWLCYVAVVASYPRERSRTGKTNRHCNMTCDITWHGPVEPLVGRSKMVVSSFSLVSLNKLP